VLHVGKFYSPCRGGMETALENICQGIQPAVDVDVVVASNSSTSKVEDVNGIRVTRCGSALTFAGASVCPGMVNAIRRSNADVIHIHLPNPTAVLAYLGSGHHGKLVFTYHSDIVRQRVLGPAFEPVLHLALSRSSAIIATSERYVRTSRTLSKYRSRCRVIPFGVNVSDFEAVDENAVAGIRQRYGKRILLSVGRLVYYKGLEFLVRAMAAIDATLLIVGEGPLEASLREQADRLGVGNRVHFLGRVEDVLPYYYACDLFVFPSIARSEAFGLVQLEAMACGKPVINTQIPSGVPFVSINGLTGLTVPPADAEALADSITMLLNEDELRCMYGRAARRRVLSEFTTEKMVRRTVDLYHEVMGVPAVDEKMQPCTQALTSESF
jgi:glycosyltransferase involved in cell wall biosynthesis